MSDDAGNKPWQGGMLALLLTIAGFIAWDLAVDQAQGGDWSHMSAEGMVLLLASAGALWQSRALLGARRALRETQTDLHRAREEATRWRADTRELLRGLGAAIQQQFTRWALTTAEAEIALLLLKGLSLKEIADARQTSERTVREQARAIYRKAELPGRASLSAFFLEEFWLPVGDDAGMATQRLQA